MHLTVFAPVHDGHVDKANVPCQVVCLLTSLSIPSAPPSFWSRRCPGGQNREMNRAGSAHARQGALSACRAGHSGLGLLGALETPPSSPVTASLQYLLAVRQVLRANHRLGAHRGKEREN